ncbi:hypothetical protein [Paraburkholderia domus]|uniref:hypothetical protein n=1 Tax=Paraburkholderia domus TaxID=2793075 RepID=UPI0019126870|nr:hypothetical protein [Paraburkholderia domus]MBK5186165.1 hypothetical protein [Burkholderia sp. R-69749]
MNLKITYPNDFPLHGLDRDMFETKRRNALRFCFYGNTVRQLAERVDARRAREVSDALPLRQIADEHAFEDCMALDGCRIDDMSAPLRRSLLRNVGARIGMTISEWGDSALPSLDEPVNHAAAHAMDVHATNRQSIETPSDSRSPDATHIAHLACNGAMRSCGNRRCGLEIDPAGRAFERNRGFYVAGANPSGTRQQRAGRSTPVSRVSADRAAGFGHDASLNLRGTLINGCDPKPERNANERSRNRCDREGHDRPQLSQTDGHLELL